MYTYPIYNKARFYQILEEIQMAKKDLKHVTTVCNPKLVENARETGCGECQASCQSACKTSCTVGNQSCENHK